MQQQRAAQSSEATSAQTSDRSSGGSSPSSPESGAADLVSTESTEPGAQGDDESPTLSAALSLALRFRVQKKMMLWDVLIAHEQALAEKQREMV